ncbi:MAG: hypothetical protein JSU72_20830, partial [Deltaproteobacteria bacterium]
VTGGRPVFTSAAVGGGAPGPVSQERGTGRGRLPPRTGALEVTRPAALEPQKRLHDPYLIKMQSI